MIVTINFRDVLVFTFCAVAAGWGLGVYTCYRYSKKHDDSQTKQP